MKYEVRQDTGYGLIPKSIMRDNGLSISAKAIYSYLASFAGNTGQAFPSVSLIIGELGISKDTFYKYMDELKEKGAIKISKERSSGKFQRNIYHLNNKLNPPCPKSSDTVSSDTVSSYTVEQDTISNSIKSNSIKSNSCSSVKEIDGDFKELIQAFEQNGFGTISTYTTDHLVKLTDEYTSTWVLDAIKLAVERNARNLRYVEGILKSWQSKGKDDGTSNSNKKITNSWKVDAT